MEDIVEIRQIPQKNTILKNGTKELECPCDAHYPEQFPDHLDANFLRQLTVVQLAAFNLPFHAMQVIGG